LKILPFSATKYYKKLELIIIKMVKYECPKCKRLFDRKSIYDDHMSRKTDCNKKNGSKTNKIIVHKCNACKKSFSRKDALQRHHKICKNIKTKTKINGNKNTNYSGNNNTIATKSNNCNNININLILFAKDGIENISTKDLAEILKSDNNIIESIISNVNLNPKKPQHHNIYYGDTKSSYGEVYENNTWVRRKIDEILEILIEAKISDLNEILNDMTDFLNKKAIKKIKETIENMDYTRPGARKKLKSYLKPILYNHKEMIIKTRKLTKEQIEEIFRKEQEEAEIEAIKEEKKIKLKKK
jgi:hypothetical protein